jgi:hypothetical protein
MKEKERKERNKSRIITAAALFVFGMALLFSGCGSGIGNRLEVTLELPDPHSINFDKYEKILYKGVTLESVPKGYDPTPEIKSFFLEDLGRVIEKKVEQWDREKHGEMVPDGLLVISGNLKISVKSRSKIEDVKGEGKGKKKKGKKQFVTVQHWDMTMTLELKDASAGKAIFKEDFKAKLANADPETLKFNFENLFFKVTTRFVKKVTRTKKMQRRHLLD